VQEKPISKEEVGLPTRLSTHHCAELRGQDMTVRMRIYDREPIGAALRHLKKLLDRSGLTKEPRK
jgi:hypothetical protein